MLSLNVKSKLNPGFNIFSLDKDLPAPSFQNHCLQVHGSQTNCSTCNLLLSEWGEGHEQCMTKVTTLSICFRHILSSRLCTHAGPKPCQPPTEASIRRDETQQKVTPRQVAQGAAMHATTKSQNAGSFCESIRLVSKTISQYIGRTHIWELLHANSQSCTPPTADQQQCNEGRFHHYRHVKVWKCAALWCRKSPTVQQPCSEVKVQSKARIIVFQDTRIYPLRLISKRCTKGDCESVPNHWHQESLQSSVVLNCIGTCGKVRESRTALKRVARFEGSELHRNL